MTQDKLKQFFLLSKKEGVFYNDSHNSFTLYKGFKITIDANDTYYIQDTRKSNYYSKVSKEDKNLIEKHGFIKGVDIISYRLNRRRVSRTKRKIERFYDKKPTASDKELKIIEKMIDMNINRLFFYKFKVSQFENKYNK